MCENLLIDEESYSSSSGGYYQESCVLCDDLFMVSDDYLYCFYDSKYFCPDCVEFLMVILGE